MHTSIQLVPTAALGAVRGARRPRGAPHSGVRRLHHRSRQCSQPPFTDKGSSLMTFIRTRRVVATIVVASCMAVPASAAAESLPSTFRTDAAQSGGDAGNGVGAQFEYPPIDFKGGDRAQSEAGGKSSDDAPPRGVGDDIMSHPGMPGFPEYDPPTRIEVVRPERTIVRDVDEVLPLILSSAALLLVLTGFGVTLVRARMVPRPGRSH